MKNKYLVNILSYVFKVCKTCFKEMWKTCFNEYTVCKSFRSAMLLVFQRQVLSAFF